MHDYAQYLLRRKKLQLIVGQTVEKGNTMNIMKRTVAAILLLAVVAVTGCSKTPEPTGMGVEYVRLGFDRIEPPLGGWFSKGFDCFAIVDDSTVATLSRNDEDGTTIFGAYTDGRLTKSSTLDGLYHGLCFGDGYLYSFNRTEETLVRLGLDFAILDTLPNSIEFGEIKNLSFSGGKLYFIAADGIGGDVDGYLSKINKTRNNGIYSDFGEVAYMYTLETEELCDLGISGVVAQSLAPDGDVYYYSFGKDEYKLSRLDAITGRTVDVADVDGVGYVFSFVFYDNLILFTDNKGWLHQVDVGDGAKRTRGVGYLVMSGGDMQFHKGNLLIMDREGGDIEVLYLDIPMKYGGEPVIIGKIGAEVRDEGYLNIGFASGINVLIEEFEYDHDALKTKLMAGDNDVDIYILYADYYTPAIRDYGMYVPLNTFEVLSAYLSGCFGYVRDYMTTENGDIWGIPLTASTLVTWYVPRNFERFGLSYNDVENIGSYMETLKRLKGDTGEYTYFNYTESLHAVLHAKYDINYNDFKNGFADYRSDIYKGFFALLRDGGWTRGDEENPYFNNPVRDFGARYSEGLEPQSFNKDIVIFQTDGAPTFTNLDRRETLDGWRVFPAPALMNGDEKNPVFITYAFVNPKSKNIGAAIEYLECLISAKDRYFGTSGAFLMADKSAYAKFYDLANPCFDDLYAVFKNGAINEPPYSSWEATGQIVDDYQVGHITIDQVVDELQRRAEMAMGE
jgi:ABC-type glycerol-3-phosphate transport system substrate-binding protein